jgi:hypothetical protein
MQVAQPALAVAWAYVLLDQDLRPIQLVGMALVIAGLVAVVTMTRRGTPLPEAVEVDDERSPRERRGRLGPQRMGSSRALGGLRGWPPPPTREPDLGNASGGTHMGTFVVVVGGGPLPPPRLGSRRPADGPSAASAQQP